MICKHCGKELPEAANFCFYCGEKVIKLYENKKKCIHCGTELTEQARFCFKCGKPVEDSRKEPLPIVTPEPAVNVTPAEPELPKKELKCPECGKIFDFEMVFCDECGTKLEEKIETTPANISFKLTAAMKSLDKRIVGTVQGAVIGINQAVYVHKKDGTVLTATVDKIEIGCISAPSANPGTNVGLLLRDVSLDKVEIGDIISGSAVIVMSAPVFTPEKSLGEPLLTIHLMSRYLGEPKVGISQGSGDLVFYGDRIEFTRKFNTFGAPVFSRQTPVIYPYNTIKSHKFSKYLGMMPSFVIEMNTGALESFAGILSLENKDIIRNILSRYGK